MESKRSRKYLRLLLMAFPFLVPWLILLVDEMCGRVMVWNYAMAVLFTVSLIALYIWGVASAIFCENKADVAYELLMFHFVKIPLYVLVWIVAMLIFALTTFSFDGIQ